MAVTVRFGILIAGACALAACSSHHSTPDPDAGSPSAAGTGRSAGRGSAAGSGSAEAGKDSGPAVTPPGARAIAELVPIDPTKRDAPDRLAGRATFAAQGASIDLLVMVRGCYGMQPFPVTIKEGRDCGEATLNGPTWDSPRGEGIPSFGCIGVASGSGRAAHARSNDADKPWTIGGPSESDVVGHAFVVSDPITLAPIACGVIERAEDAPYAPPLAPGEGPKIELQAQIAGICLAQTFSQDNTRPCPDPNELVKCSSEHCNLGACLEACKDYTACLTDKADPCESMFECPSSDACTDCQGEVGSCSFSFCLDVVSCAPPPTPDGPCAQLAACCQMQGDQAQGCLEFVQLLERLSGDVSCRGAMMDWDTTAHLPVPCKFD